MASQPPVQYNLMSPSIPNATGTSQPPLLQRPITSNGIGQPSAGSRFPVPATSNSVPVSATTNSQWARPPVSSQFAPSTMSQPSFTAAGLQQCNPAIFGQDSPRPVLETQSSGRPPSSSSGIYLCVCLFYLKDETAIKNKVWCNITSINVLHIKV